MSSYKNFFLVIVLYIFTLLSNAQEIKTISYVSSELISNEGLYFEGTLGVDYKFGKRITPHGDCIDVLNGYMFVTWYKGGMDKRNLMVSRKKIDGGSWQTIEFPDRHIGYQGNPTIGDSHNTAAIIVCPIDSTIHLLYDMHAYSKSGFPSNFFNYRVSLKGKAFVSDAEWNISIFNDKRNYLKNGVNYERSTYPGFNRFDDGRIMADIRFGGSGNGNDQYAIYDGNEWSANIQFNNGNQPVADEVYSIYGSYKYMNGRFYNGFSIRYSLANTDDNFKYQINNGLFYAYADSPYGKNDWKDINGNSIAIPMQNPNVVKFAEPCEIGLGNYISIGPQFTITQNNDIHFLTKVTGKPVHFYKKQSDSDFKWTTNCPSPDGDLFSIGDNILLVTLENDRPVFKVSPGGENNWTTILKMTTGDALRHCNVAMDGNKIIIYAMTKGSGKAQPLKVLTFDVTFKTTGFMTGNIKENKLHVYPNPSNNGIFKLSESQKWNLFSYIGVKILDGESEYINLSAYNKGLYILKTQNSNAKLVYDFN